jgi:hypothetical protein
MIRRCRPVAAIVGVFVLAAATTTSRSASTTTPFPDASNTGVPAGIVLTDYVGPTTVTQAGTVIDAKTIRGKLVIATDNVTIKRSKVLGTIDSDRPGSHVTILDSEIDGGKSQSPAVGYGNITMSRVNVYGSRVSSRVVRTASSRILGCTASTSRPDLIGT